MKKKLNVFGIMMMIIMISFVVIGCPSPADDSDIGEHEHSAAVSANWSYNETQHWKECTDSDGGIIERGAHTGNWLVANAATAAAEGSRSRECVVCGYKQTKAIAKLINLGYEMKDISAGSFSMGQSDISNAQPVRTVTLSAFKIGAKEVTQVQYQTVMGNNPSSFKGENLPVESVSWYDAVIFCNTLSEKEGLTPVYYLGTNDSTYPEDWGEIPTSSLHSNDAILNGENGIQIDSSANGYRLPTEAEWEYACRAGTITAYNTGDTIDDNAAWYKVNGENTTHPVGTKTANAWGLYDMHGNVTEWSWDRVTRYSLTDLNNPTGGSFEHKLRGLRGGDWNYDAEHLRSASRTGSGPTTKSSRIGFRVVRN